MVDIETGLSALPFDQRAGLTVVIVLVMIVLFFGSQLLAKRSTARRKRWVALGLATVFFLSLVGGSGFLVVLWDLEAAVSDVYGIVGTPVGIALNGVLTVIFLAIVYAGTSVIHSILSSFIARRDDITEHESEIAFRIIQVTIYILAILVVLRIWGVELGGILIGAGFAGIVVGMAARQTLGAVIAGFVLMFSRPFEIGDWVQVEDKEGIVTDITIVNTRLQTFDGEYVVLPNDVIGSSEVVNRSRKGRLRLHVEVGVDYTTDPEQAMNVAKEAMGEVDDILTVPRPEVVLKEFGDSSVVLDLRYWIDKPSARRMWRAHTAVISAVKQAFDEAGIKIPFPQRELTGRQESGGFRVSGPQPEDVTSPPGSTRPDGSGDRTE